ncbi:FAD-dependent oxidoreductase [Pseudonocardia halophobica]|uniref:Monooxygenase, FAD-binding protein n=1 Tax=Pseudonocardia halophobica TaxID=29401 RepID=A0A9W6L162_9PSEU|nr:FAD-dependent oxidoreductase [Pseudonocardia halophobica]GLL10920.1 putative monooxygenase, FAD-binding protein [Pseudonocardia halophobica]
MMNNDRTTACVVGGGPAGMVLGLLLARAGVEVTVLEKHADFLRDFRGDTVHPSTLELLDELGLGARFDAMPHRRVDSIRAMLDGGTVQIGNFSLLHHPRPYVALTPQWDFLNLLAAAGEEEPTFTLVRDAEVTGLLTDEDRVTGVRWRDRVTGEEHTLQATLTIGCDGRGSTVREASGLRSRAFGVPLDVEWFRLPRLEGDPEGGVGRFTRGHFAVMIDRGDYWQCGYLIRKGGDAELRAKGIDTLRTRLSRLIPWTTDRVGALQSWDDVSLLDVRLDRLRRWSKPGLLLIGDAAHAMSPVGGVGINLAVADAVAAARIVGPALRSGPISPVRLAGVQARRWLPAAVIQGVQRGLHRVILGAALDVDPDAPVPPATELPRVVRFAQRHPKLQLVPARLFGLGLLPEHAPAWARRPQAPVQEPAEV